MQESNDTYKKINLIYKDNYILAVYKPKGLDFHTENINLVSGVSKLVNQRVFPVHRLDKDVDGVVIFALDNYTANKLVNNFKEGKVEKFYVGVVNGKIVKPLRIATPLKSGQILKKAETYVWPLRRLNNLSLIKIVISSGRFHQIKRHLSKAGYPLLKDSSGVFLSSVMISILHPRTRKRIFLSCFQKASVLKKWSFISGEKLRLSKSILLR